jgi:hypothetical protein
VSSFWAQEVAEPWLLVSLGAILPKRDRRMLSSWCAVVLGLFVVAAALAPWFWALPPLVLVAGFALTFSNTAANTLLQTTSAPAVRGQTISSTCSRSAAAWQPAAW